MSQLLTISNGGKRREVTTPNIHKSLETNSDSENSLLGHNNAFEWVQEEFGMVLKYNKLRTYMKRRFKTKLKVHRKSHYKKDDQAIELLKNLPESLKFD